MSWKEPADRHNDAIVEAIHAASRHIATALKEGFQLMADAQTQALADLSAAVSAMATAVTAAVNEIATLIAANQNIQPDDSAAIEAQVTAIKTATAALTAAVPTPAPAVTP